MSIYHDLVLLHLCKNKNEFSCRHEFVTEQDNYAYVERMISVGIVLGLLIVGMLSSSVYDIDGSQPNETRVDTPVGLEPCLIEIAQEGNSLVEPVAPLKILPICA